MKNKVLPIVAWGVMCLAAPCFAGVVTPNDDIVISNWSAGQAVGPYWSTIYEDDTSGAGTGTDVKASFFTFRVERSRPFVLDTRHNISGIGTPSTAQPLHMAAAAPGGSRLRRDDLDWRRHLLGDDVGNNLYAQRMEQHADAPRKLTGYAAWVYEQFVHGVEEAGSEEGWSETNIPSGWGDTLNLYQRAIWAGMIGPGGSVGAKSAEWRINDWTAYEAIDIGYTDFLNSTWGGTVAGGDEATKMAHTGAYFIANMDNGNQSQPFLMPGVSHENPEPASFAIWAVVVMGAAGLAFRRRGSRRRWDGRQRQAIHEVISRA